MKIEYDKEIDTKFIFLKKGKVYKTKRVEDWLLFDLAKTGEILALEILDASKHPVGISTIGENLVGYYEMKFKTTGNNERNADVEIAHKNLKGTPILLNS